MSFAEFGDVRIRFEEKGEGFPVLLLAPGGMTSSIEFWERQPFHPLEVFSDVFHMVGMDQRNAGESVGPLDVEDPWGSYVSDQLALMDQLGFERFHVIGQCIGPSYALKMIERAPERVTAAVFVQPIGVTEENRDVFTRGENSLNWRDYWGSALLEQRPELSAEELDAFGNAMWGDDAEFVVSVSREFVTTVQTPLLVMPGVPGDLFHPGPIGREIIELAPNAEQHDPWRDTPERIEETIERTRAFLKTHTPTP